MEITSVSNATSVEIGSQFIVFTIKHVNKETCFCAFKQQ